MKSCKTDPPTKRAAADGAVGDRRASPDETFVSNQASDRQVFETRLGNFLFMHPWSVEISKRMTLACLTYLQVRARRSPTTRTSDGTFECLRKMLRPVPFPFGGRVRNVCELMGVLGRASQSRAAQVRGTQMARPRADWQLSCQRNYGNAVPLKSATWNRVATDGRFPLEVLLEQWVSQFWSSYVQTVAEIPVTGLRRDESGIDRQLRCEVAFG